MTLLINFILTIGILLNAVALIELLRLKHKKTPQYILIVFWLFILGVLLNFYAITNNLNLLIIITSFLKFGVRLFIPPLIFLYVQSVFLTKKGLIKRNLYHFIPFILNLLFFTIPWSFKANYSYLNFIIKHYLIWVMLFNSFGIIYFLAALKFFYKAKQGMKQNFSNLNFKDALWIEKFLISFLLVLITDNLLTISEVSFGYNTDWDSYITVLFIIIAMSYIGYYGIHQSSFFLPPFLIKEDKTKQTSEAKNYIKEKDKELLKTKFNLLMDTEKIYLDPDLNLKKMASKMEIPERKLTAFFTEILHSNFYNTINTYRVELIKQKLQSNTMQSHSVTGIGLSCGFNSKSSFYRIFKKHTGLSPANYYKSLNNKS